MALRVILHLDLDSFFASCEEQRNPALKGKPVVICNYTRGLDSGAVTTANYVARKLGIKSGMPVSFARRAAKNAVDAVFLPTDIDYYSQVSDQVMQLLQAYADAFEPASIDEAFLEVTQRLQGDFGKAEALGRELKARILEKTGLTCSVGIASNKLLAKTASDFRKPDGLTVGQPGREAVVRGRKNRGSFDGTRHPNYRATGGPTPGHPHSLVRGKPGPLLPLGRPGPGRQPCCPARRLAADFPHWHPVRAHGGLRKNRGL